MADNETCTTCGTAGIAEVVGEDYLGPGCIPYTGEARLLPEGSQIKSPRIRVLDLVRNFIVLRDGEVQTCRPKEIQKGEKILAVEPNKVAIDILNETYQGRGVLIKNFDGELKTYDEWPQGFVMWAVQSVVAGSGVTVEPPAGRQVQGVQTLPRAGSVGRKPLQLSRLSQFKE